MRISRALLAALAFHVPLVVHFLARSYIGAVQPGRAELALIVRVDGVLSGAVYLVCFVYLVLAFAIGRPIPRVTPLARTYLVLSIVAMAYFTGLVVLSPVVGNTVSYTVGDLYRALLPFITLVVLFSVFPDDDEFRRRFIDTFVVVITAIAIIGGAFKAYYAAQGIFYGSGLRQYTVGVFLLSYVLLRLTQKSYSPPVSLLWSVLLFVLVALSILSLKRGNWVAIALAIMCVLLLATRRARAVAFVSCLVLLAGVGAYKIGLMDLIVARFMYTFSGERGVDSSTFERLAEAAGALATLKAQGTPLVYLTGLGHGAEFMADPSFPLSTAGTGSAPGLYHHIHITPFLLLFRYGVVGGVLYALIVLPALATAARLASRSFRAFAVQHRYGQVYIATLIHVLVTLVLGMKGNIIYGDADFAMVVFILVSAYLIVSEEYRATVEARV